MTITVNLNDENTRNLQASAMNELSINELVNSLIAQYIQSNQKSQDPYEEKFNMFLQSLDEFTDDFMADGRMQDLPQERESL